MKHLTLADEIVVIMLSRRHWRDQAAARTDSSNKASAGGILMEPLLRDGRLLI